MPVFIILFYRLNFNRLTDPDFEEKYGEVYAGMNPEKKSTIFYTVFFLVRRYIFVISICWIEINPDLKNLQLVWIQIAIQLVLALGSAVFLITFSPFADFLPARLEIFNEITTLVLLYHVMNFTDFILEEKE